MDVMRELLMNNLANSSVTTRDLLMDTAETLFAEKGVEGASLRAIGLKAGQNNTVAVQYYFKNRKGLIEAVLESRFRQIEDLRTEKLESLLAANPDPSLEELVSVLQKPLLGLNSSNIFARFLLQYLTSSTRWEFHTGNGVRGWLTNGVTYRDSATFQLLDLIAAKLPDVPRHVLGARLVQCMRMLMGSVVDWENMHNCGQPTPKFETLISDQISMIGAALHAPISNTFAENTQLAEASHHELLNDTVLPDRVNTSSRWMTS